MTADLQDDPLPKYTWWVLGLTAVALLALTVGAIGFISAGTFDPKPVGELTAELNLQTITVPARSQTIEWFSLPEPMPDSFTVRLEAAYQSGELDAGYGLVLGSDESGLLTAVSPLGYTTISYYSGQQLPLIGTENGEESLDGMIANRPFDGQVALKLSDNPILPWQPWPHVRLEQETNEIWLDKRGELITVFINRELLWQGPVSLSSSRLALWAASFNETTTINFKTLQFFRE